MKSHVEGKELVLEDDQRFKLNGVLDLRGSGITALPANLTVGGEIIGFNPTEECNNDMGM